MKNPFPLFRPSNPLDAAASGKVVDCIREAELQTTGEIRVYMEPSCKHPDAMIRATELFAGLGMEQTELRNGVLLYIAWSDHRFAIYGDSAIYEKSGTGLWEHAAGTLQAHLQRGDMAEGLCACIREIGTALALHFPPDPAVSKNELPDEIIFGK